MVDHLSQEQPTLRECILCEVNGHADTAHDGAAVMGEGPEFVSRFDVLDRLDLAARRLVPDRIVKPQNLAQDFRAAGGDARLPWLGRPGAAPAGRSRPALERA